MAIRRAEGLTPAPRVLTDALRANLARTAVDVAVPDRHRILLEIAEPWSGVHRATRELLHEIHHLYVGWPQALADLHRRATDDLHRHVADPRGPTAIGVMCELYAKVAAEALPAAVALDGLRAWLRYLQMVVLAPGPSAEARLRVVASSLGDMEALFADAPSPPAGVTGPLKRLVSALRETPGEEADTALGRALTLLGAALAEMYGSWAASPDPMQWHRDIAGPQPPPAPRPIRDIAQSRMSLHRDAVERVLRGPESPRRRADLLLGMPDEAQIQRAYLDAADVIGAADGGPAAPRARLRWLLRVLGQRGLGPVHEPALRRAAASFSEIVGEGTGTEAQEAVRETLGILRAGTASGAHGVQRLVAEVGRRCLATGDPELAETLVDEVLRLDFDYPDFSGFTMEWGIAVNRAHLRRIRADLAVIEADPLRARALIAGLVVQLRLGGIFVADTDLVQRDVSSLLSRPVGPVYLEVKQLLRLLPVYFNEIGAEGALREASTRLDEVSGRRDPLCHFLRKQSHVECNPRLIGFTEEILRFWLTGDPDPLRRYVPDEVMAAVDPGSTDHRRASEVVRWLAGTLGGVEGLASIDPAEVERLVHEKPELDRAGGDRVVLLLRVRREIARKYAIDHTDVIPRLRAFGRLDEGLIDRLEHGLAAGEEEEEEEAIDAALGVLESLRAIVLSAGETRAHESIYRKRHIAAGIPSMYGSYHEERFEAMGLTFRTESLAGALLGRLARARSPEDAAPGTLRDVARRLGFHVRALRIDGFRARGLEHALGMLEEVLAESATTAAQHLNVFQAASRAIEDMIRVRILDAYRLPVERIVPRMVERGILDRPREMTTAEAALVHSEALLRDLVAESLGMQGLDALVGRMIRLLAERSTEPPAPRGRAPEVGTCVVSLAGPEDHRNVASLGNKAFMLRRLSRLGVRVPEGCVLTAELHRQRDVVRASPRARAAIEDRVRAQVAGIERVSGLAFGDPARPLLLSVRSGAAISMPGMLETFLNVGMNPAVAEGMARVPGRAWAAWDAYRRLLQTWGMSRGLPRELFDELIAGEKERRGVPLKALLPAASMRGLALSYREALFDHGAAPVDDPLDQLAACIEAVQDSWDSERARLYRQELHIADEWGTAVTIQRMVFGNLGPRAGTGVLFTRPPQRRSQAVELHGDFVVQSQGDDVVGGLVETFPLTERQRAAQGRPPPSLEVEFPEIHAELLSLARRLVEREELNHQELEFTFESPRRRDLYVLQARDTVVSPPGAVAAFSPGPRLEASRVAVGIGVGGGALSGRVAHTAGDIRFLRDRDPHGSILLLRRDTVPEDVPLVLGVEGLLTSLGGATSHAAVAAKRLGKAGVVGCRDLQVREGEGRSWLAGWPLDTGDVISIDGTDGSVYLGEHAVISVRTGEESSALAPERGGGR